MPNNNNERTWNIWHHLGRGIVGYRGISDILWWISYVFLWPSVCNLWYSDNCSEYQVFARGERDAIRIFGWVLIFSNNSIRISVVLYENQITLATFICFSQLSDIIYGLLGLYLSFINKRQVIWCLCWRTSGASSDFLINLLRLWVIHCQIFFLVWSIFYRGIACCVVCSGVFCFRVTFNLTRKKQGKSWRGVQVETSSTFWYLQLSDFYPLNWIIKATPMVIFSFLLLLLSLSHTMYSLVHKKLLLLMLILILNGKWRKHWNAYIEIDHALTLIVWPQLLLSIIDQYQWALQHWCSKIRLF